MKHENCFWAFVIETMDFELEGRRKPWGGKFSKYKTRKEWEEAYHRECMEKKKCHGYNGIFYCFCDEK